MKRFVLAMAFAAAFAFAAGASAQPPKNPERPTDPLVIISGGKPHDFKVELVNTPQESEMGLMYRSSMPKDHGMIFSYKPAQDIKMGMKNTLIPLDILFMDADGTVIAVAEKARPGSLREVGPGLPVSSVLEVNAGVAKEAGVKPGDKVEHKIFGNLKANGG